MVGMNPVFGKYCPKIRIQTFARHDECLGVQKLQGNAGHTGKGMIHWAYHHIPVSYTHLIGDAATNVIVNAKEKELNKEVYNG